MIYGRQIAYWVGLIVTLVIGAVSTLAGEGLISDALRGQVENAVQAIAQLLVLVSPLIAGAIIKPRVTPISDPRLAAGTEVQVEDSDDTVIIEKTPPGPTGVEDGAADEPQG